MNKLKYSPKTRYKLEAGSGFPIFKRGDIVLTNNRTSWLAKMIRKLTREKGEAKSKVNHALIYVADGRGIEAGNWRIFWCKMDKYFTGKHDVYILRERNLSDAERSEITWKAIKYLNRPYNYLQILGMAAYNKTGWKWTKKYIKTPWGMICSGMVGEVYFGRQDMAPDDLFDLAESCPEERELIRVV